MPRTRCGRSWSTARDENPAPECSPRRRSTPTSSRSPRPTSTPGAASESPHRSTRGRAATTPCSSATATSRGPGGSTCTTSSPMDGRRRSCSTPSPPRTNGRRRTMEPRRATPMPKCPSTTTSPPTRRRARPHVFGHRPRGWRSRPTALAAHEPRRWSVASCPTERHSWNRTTGTEPSARRWRHSGCSPLPRR